MVQPVVLRWASRPPFIWRTAISSRLLQSTAACAACCARACGTRRYRHRRAPTPPLPHLALALPLQMSASREPELLPVRSTILFLPSAAPRAAQPRRPEPHGVWGTRRMAREELGVTSTTAFCSLACSRWQAREARYVRVTHRMMYMAYACTCTCACAPCACAHIIHHVHVRVRTRAGLAQVSSPKCPVRRRLRAGACAWCAAWYKTDINTDTEEYTERIYSSRTDGLTVARRALLAHTLARWQASNKA